MNIHTIQYVCVLLSQGMALIKGSNSIYPRKWFRLLQTGKLALKPNAPQPTPHVERTGLVVNNTAGGKQMMGLDKEPNDPPETWSLIGCCQTVCGVHGWCVWCVQVVNSSEQLLLIPHSVVAKTTLMLVREQKWVFLRLFYGFVSCQSWWILVFFGAESNLLPLLSNFFISSPSIGVQQTKKESRPTQMFLILHPRTSS